MYIVSSGLFCKKPHRDRKSQIRDRRNREIIRSFLTFPCIKAVHSVNLVTKDGKIGTCLLPYTNLLHLIHRVKCIMDLLADLTIEEKIVTLFVIQQLFLFIHSFLKGEEFNAEKEKRRSYSRRKHCRRSS